MSMRVLCSEIQVKSSQYSRNFSRGIATDILHEIYNTAIQHKALREEILLNTTGSFRIVGGADILEEMAQNSCSALTDGTGLSSLVHQWKKNRPWQKKWAVIFRFIHKDKSHR